MKKGWITRPLIELCEVFVDGDWVESKDQSSEGIRLIQTGNVGVGVFKDRSEKSRYISDTTFQRLRCTEIQEGDCLISRLPDPVGRSCLLPDIGERMITAVDCTIVRFKCDTCLPEFFNYYSQSDVYLATVAKECTGTTRSRISRSNLGLTPIPVPPLPEQQRIVGILDEAFGGLATAQAHAAQNLQNARDLFESHLNAVFTQRGDGWVETTIGDCIRFIDYRGKTPTKTPIGLRLITAKNVKMGFLQREPEEFVAPESYDGWMTRGIPRVGDVLFTEAPLANIAQLDTSDKVVFAQRIIIMQSDAAKLDSTFLKYLLLSNPIQDRIHAKGTGATVKGIKASLLKTIKVSFPKTIQKQQHIVSQLDALSAETQRLTRIYEQKLVALAELKKSLLHQAFSGDI
jgi:type I restriction enzyme S subunit